MEKNVLAMIRKYQRFVVLTHVHPDADALGAALAMTLYLKALKKQVHCLNDEACPRWLRFMPKTSLYETYSGKNKFVPEVAIIVDCGDLDRVGRVKALLGKETVVVNIDHHVTNANFGSINSVHSESSSTSEIIYDLMRSARFPLTKDMAVLLYLGIMTDTGSFGFNNTSPRTHAVVAELLKFGFSVSDLFRQVYETMPNRDLKPFFSVLNRCILTENDQVACLVMSRKDTQRFSGEFDLRDKIFQFFRSVRGLVVIVIFTELKPGKIRVNFRSRGALDVARLAERFGGGGHKNASGCFLDGSLPQAQARILKEIKRSLI